MAIIDSPANIKDIYSALDTGGFQPPDLATSRVNRSKVDIAAKQFEAWGNPDSITYDEQILVDAGITPEFFSQSASQLQAASSGMGELETHVQGVPGTEPGAPGSMGANNLVKNMGIVSAEKTRQETLGIAPQDPCDALAAFFDGVTGGFQLVLSTIGTAIDEILDLIAQGIEAVIAAIDSVIGPALDAIGQAIDEIAAKIAEELNNLAKAFADVLKFSEALSLPALFKDPCFRAVINVTAPPALKTSLEIADELLS